MSGAMLPRGTVTFLFTDIEGSSELVRRLGGELFATLRAEHRRLLRAAFAANGGHEIDTAGDGFFVVFDTARRAAAAATEAQLALSRFSWPDGAELRVRIGLHTAEPHLGADGYVGIGVHRAARICDAAHGGQILISNATAGILEDGEPADLEVTDVGEFALKGLPRRQRLFQLRAEALGSDFGPPRAAVTDQRAPGVGTFVHTDVTGFRRVVEALGDEATAALAADYQRAVGAVVEQYGGVVLERGGDHMFAVFGNAGDAVRAAAAIQETLEDFAWPPDANTSLTIAVHSGRWSGDPIHPAAASAFARLVRLMQVARPGQVLVSQATVALLEGDRDVPKLRLLGARDLRGFDEVVSLYELASG